MVSLPISLGKSYWVSVLCAEPRDLKDSESSLPLKNEERGLNSEPHCFETFPLQGTKHLIPERMVPKGQGSYLPLRGFSLQQDEVVRHEIGTLCQSQKPHFEPPPSTDWGPTLQYLDLSGLSSDSGLNSVSNK
jgi:hypothetical protein